jgi:hypothetical protein
MAVRLRSSSSSSMAVRMCRSSSSSGMALLLQQQQLVGAPWCKNLEHPTPPMALERCGLQALGLLPKVATQHTRHSIFGWKTTACSCGCRFRAVMPVFKIPFFSTWKSGSCYDMVPAAHGCCAKQRHYHVSEVELPPLLFSQPLLFLHHNITLEKSSWWGNMSCT